MKIEKALMERSGMACELCTSTNNISEYTMPASPGNSIDERIVLCENCLDQVENADKVDVNHWRCLNDSMWSQVPAVQVMVWRMLSRLRNEGWPQDLLDQMYLDDDTLDWARANGDGEADEDAVIHKDCNGVTLQSRDNVVLIKDLDVKGANFTAKRGTAVRNISLVADNPEHIEGRVNGQHIVILCKFVKKS